MADAPKDDTPREGEELAGKYRIERVLGRGGMGVVVGATHLELEQRVAIKFLYTEALESAEAVARFMREARLAVRIKSEHVCKVLDIGRRDNGAPYMVMEYLEGADLAALLQKRGPFSLEDAVEYLVQACEAIAEAHSIGVVHRDLKPHNLFLTRRADGSPCIKVLDFGVSKIVPVAAIAQPELTSTQSMMGTPLYMSPEQMSSAKHVDPRSDIWALGAIFYQLLTGAAPFPAETIPELCSKVLTERPTPIRAHRPDLPAGVDKIVERTLERDLSRRYQNVAELATALADIGPPRLKASAERSTRVIMASSTKVEVATSDLATARTASSWSAQPSRTRASKPGIALGLAVSLVVGGLCALFVFLRHPEQTSVAPAAAPSATELPAAKPEPSPPPSATASSVATSEPARSAEPPASASAPNPVKQPPKTGGKPREPKPNADPFDTRR